jgi:SAM-dependent methyltransferase
VTEITDSTHPDFWSSRYVAGKTPWDFQGVPRALTAFLARNRTRKRRSVLIPGCGSGYEIAAFAAAGFEVTAIDFSPVAIKRARRIFGRLASRIVLADFFEHDFGRGFDLIYERTFLCALPPARWPDYARRLAALAASEGRLVGTYFIGRAKGGPPFPITEIKLNKLLGRAFRRVRNRPVVDSLPVFGDGERWQEWRRCARKEDVRNPKTIRPTRAK